MAEPKSPLFCKIVTNITMKVTNDTFQILKKYAMIITVKDGYIHFNVKKTL